ncbi:MAG: tRNA (adenine-N1)-methyltransferase [Chloroflexi bacterium 44-23]|nr:MAG: tRNA (adenine-N1)-methyltransferase [Chloroflexi bacterium 44-23]
MWNISGKIAQEGDMVQLVGLRHKSFIVNLKIDAELHTHRGIVKHNNLIGLPYGSKIYSHNGAPFFLVIPSIAEVLLDLKRSTQILYPKDIGFLLINLGIGPGQHVVEAGTGSGGMTTALAFAVGREGKVTTYEQRVEFQNLARKNLARLGLDDSVDFKLRDIADGFDEKNVDAFFLDVQNPYDYIEQVRECLKPGGFFGCLVPTTNQVSRLLIALRMNKFAFIDVVEVLLRYYKPEPERLRPTDRMVAHTGFLVFGRPMISDSELEEPLEGEIELSESEQVDE